MRFKSPGCIPVYLGLGSNLGDREENLRGALEYLDDNGQLTLIRVSSVYETLPWGLEEQPCFLNLVAEVISSAPAREVLSLIKNIERRLGREPGMRWGPRLIDIDILLYGDLELKGPELEIPHPHMWERAFVLVPLGELLSCIPVSLTRELAACQGVRWYLPGDAFLQGRGAGCLGGMG